MWKLLVQPSAYFLNTHRNSLVLLNASRRKPWQTFTFFSAMLLSSHQEKKHDVTANSLHTAEST
jgi:hypothetical protein